MGQVKWTKFEPKSSELLTLHDKLSIIDILRDLKTLIQQKSLELSDL